MKLTDYVADFLASNHVTHAFGMSGGAAVHMFDSIDRHPEMQIVSMTHEQCAAMAADGYSRATGRLGVAITTSGPGATNLLTGTCCSYYDSVPTLMLTGQVATHRLRGNRQVRQVGFQETDVVSIFKPVTKYAVQLTDAKAIRFHLEKALYLAFEGRPGPVLIDIPDDLQRADVDPAALEPFVAPPAVTLEIDAAVRNLLNRLSTAERPVVVLGGGLKTPPVGPVLQECIARLGVPVLVSWAATDLIPANDSLRIGTFGVYGPRGGNYAVQNADLVIALGTRLGQNMTGGIVSSFARAATIVMVDVDRHEMDKFDGRGLNVEVRIEARLSDFCRVLRRHLESWRSPQWEPWKYQICRWREKFGFDPSPRKDERPCVDAYEFMSAFSEALPEGALLYVDTGGNLTWTCNGLSPKVGQALHSAWNHTPMGYALPAAIGGSKSSPNRPVACIIGDGGLMLCLAELATVVKHRVPMKLFLFNNHSHGIQKQTLETWLGGRYVCVDPGSGLAFPTDFCRIAESFGLPSLTINNATDAERQIEQVFAQPGPMFVNVEVNPDQKLYPVLKYGAALENQMPALDPAVIANEMLIPPFQSTPSNVPIQQTVPGW